LLSHLSFDLFRKENYQPSSEQVEKISKKSEYQKELAKLDQYLIRVTNREKLLLTSDQKNKTIDDSLVFDNISTPLGSVSSAVVSETTSAVKSIEGEHIRTKKRNKKEKYIPFDLSGGPVSEKSPYVSAEKKPGESLSIDIKSSVGNPPATFSQWAKIFSDSPSKPTANLLPKENHNIKAGEPEPSKKTSISTTLSNGRTVLSPAEPKALFSSDVSSSTKAVKTVGSHDDATVSSPSTFALADFLTPVKKHPTKPASAHVHTSVSSPVAVKSSPSVMKPIQLNPWQKKEGSQTTPVVSATPVSLSSSTTATPKASSLLQIQNEEEYLKQNSKIILKGNEIPWRIERQFKTESLNQLIEKERLAKLENDEIIKQVQRFQENDKTQQHKPSGTKRSSEKNQPGHHHNGKPKKPSPAESKK
jgi:hypothetical protein